MALQKKSITTIWGKHELWQIGLRGQISRKEKWYSKEKVEEKLSHLI
jgi:hypothetical protein